jgi:hypothetical protein
MTRSLVFVSLLVLLVASVVQAQAPTAADGSTYLFAELRGSSEVPANNSTAVGSALVVVDSNNVVTFEVNIGSVQNVTLSHIHEGAATCACPVVVSFANNSSQFSNGRTKGTVQTTADIATRLKANPAGFYVNVHSSQFGGGEIRGQLAPANENDIEIAGNVTTGAGDKFVTDVRVFNPSTTAKAVALVEFLVSSGGGNTNATASKTLEIAPRGEAVLDDVTGPANLNSTGTTGALRITSNVALLASSNIFNDQRGATPSRGTFGQFVPAIARGNALRKGVILHLSNKTRDLANPSGFRTNLGFFNPNQTAVTVALTLRDAAGTSLGTATIGLAGWSQQQTAITTYFPSVDLSNASGLTVSFDASLPIDGYGAVNDNVSGDSIMVPAQPDSP